MYLSSAIHHLLQGTDHALSVLSAPDSSALPPCQHLRGGSVGGGFPLSFSTPPSPFGNLSLVYAEELSHQSERGIHGDAVLKNTVQPAYLNDFPRCISLHRLLPGLLLAKAYAILQPGSFFVISSPITVLVLQSSTLGSAKFFQTPQLLTAASQPGKRHSSTGGGNGDQDGAEPAKQSQGDRPPKRSRNGKSPEGQKDGSNTVKERSFARGWKEYTEELFPCPWSLRYPKHYKSCRTGTCRDPQPPDKIREHIQRIHTPEDKCPYCESAEPWPEHEPWYKAWARHIRIQRTHKPKVMKHHPHMISSDQWFALEPELQSGRFNLQHKWEDLWRRLFPEVDHIPHYTERWEVSRVEELSRRVEGYNQDHSDGDSSNFGTENQEYTPSSLQSSSSTTRTLNVKGTAATTETTITLALENNDESADGTIVTAKVTSTMTLKKNDDGANSKNRVNGRPEELQSNATNALAPGATMPVDHPHCPPIEQTFGEPATGGSPMFSEFLEANPHHEMWTEYNI